MKIFIIIPLFNEEKHIVGVLRGVSKYKLPIVVVDDGSSDNSKAKSQKAKLQFKIKDFTLLEHKINLGKGAAMKTGAEYAFFKGADAIIFMDSDGQHEPGDLIKFIKALESKNYDVVLGSRNYGYGVPLVRYLGSKFASLLIAFLFKIYVSDVACGFRALTKDAYKKLKWESSGYGVETEMVAKLGKSGLRHCEVPVKAVYHDKVKGVTILDAFGIVGDVIQWKLTL
jgi:glycosyltransferase involved in cell wall biosynthesis